MSGAKDIGETAAKDIGAAKRIAEAAEHAVEETAWLEVVEQRVERREATR